MKHNPPSHTTSPCTEATAEACRTQLRLLADEMAEIRTQIATADIRRQAARRALDAQWFQQAKAALHAKQQAAAQLTAHLKTLTARNGREGFKDALIDLIRPHYDTATWAQLIAQARGTDHG